MSQIFEASVPQALQAYLELQYVQQLKKIVFRIIQKSRYWMIDGEKLIYDSKTRLLWDGQPKGDSYYDEQYNSTSYKNGILQRQLSTLGQFRLPTKDELMDVAKNNFPLRRGINYRLQDIPGWLVQGGRVYLDSSNPTIQYGGYVGRVISVVSMIQSRSLSTGVKIDGVTADLHYFATQKLAIKPHHGALTESEQSALKHLMDGFSPVDLLKEIDWISTRLPQLDQRRFFDVDQGLWELAESHLSERTRLTHDQPIQVRHPRLDIKNSNVAIDFGTSSTVVALREDGRDQLLRIGVQNHYSTPQAKDYENPTVLEFVDFEQMLQRWHSVVYRPLVNWDDVRCSHVAKTNLKGNLTNPKMISSVFARLKQWALRDDPNKPLWITDREGHQHSINTLTERNPIKGQPLTEADITADFDPIELYAWFLGMNINWRQRGIFLNYYMTFPVAYPVATKQKILASFRRGLQRSLPEALIEDEVFHQFKVEERASEPAAFAAAALHALDIKPTEDGVAYAVFDFGGGTTDFDYGLYRYPVEGSEEEAWEEVIEHFGSAGDKFLGGENLVENLAYQVFCKSINECRSKKIPFTLPLDAIALTGAEMLIDSTQAAQSNTTMLMARLRPIWENTDIELNGNKLSVGLFNHANELTPCELTVNPEELRDWLKQRIEQGINNFLVAMKKSFDQQQRNPEEIHVLLGGNSCRSDILRELFGLDDGATSYVQTYLQHIYPQQAPELIVHQPLDSDDDNPHAATTKTSVALGLLRICPNEPILVINHSESHAEDSPFQFVVGTHRRGVFQPAILRNAAYHDWVELGLVREGLFALLYSSSPSAEMMDLPRGHQDLKERQIRFAHSPTGHRVYGRVVSPNMIELCCAASVNHLAQVDHVVEEVLA
jgi:hypothetical protein